MNPRLVDRVSTLNTNPINEDGKYVLYWMIANRRFHSNAALEYAAHMAKQHNVPLLVLEEVSTRHKFANDRITSSIACGLQESGCAMATFPYIRQIVREQTV